MGMYLGGNQVTYNGTVYSGLDLSGAMWLEVNLPSRNLNFLVVDGRVAAGVFGGLNNAGDHLYVRVYGNSSVGARLQLPSDWPIIGGLKILGADVDAAVVGQTKMRISNVTEAVNDLFKNLSVKVGLAGTASILGSDVRAWVILPDVAQSARKGTNWGLDFKLFGSLPDWKLGATG